MLCPQNVLTEFVYVMDKIYHVPKKEIHNMLSAFIDTPGMEVVHDLNLKTLLKLWPLIISDFGDAIIASLASKIKGAVVITFDRRLRTSLKKAAIPLIPLRNGSP